MINSPNISVRDILPHIPIFSDIEPEPHELLSNHATLHNIPAEENAVSPTSRSVLCMVSGLAELQSPMRSGISFYAAGDLIAEEAAIRRSAFPYSVRARTCCDVLAISAEAFRIIWSKSPLLQRKLSALYQQQTEAYEDYCRRWERASRPARIALALRSIALSLDHHKKVAWDNAYLPFTLEWWRTKQVISDTLAVSTPKVRETLLLLAQEGAIDIGEKGDRKINLPVTLMEGCVPILTRLIETNL